MIDQLCQFCIDLDEMEGECPDEPHHGKEIICDDCEATYYEEFGSGRRWASNDQAHKNHPELKII